MNKITKIISVHFGQIGKTQDVFENCGQEHTEEITIIWIITPHQWLSKQLINLPNSLLSKFESGDCHLQQPSWLKTNCYRHCSENICTSPQCRKIQKMMSNGKIKHVLLLENNAGNFPPFETQETIINTYEAHLTHSSFYAHCGHPKIIKLKLNDYTVCIILHHKHTLSFHAYLTEHTIPITIICKNDVKVSFFLSLQRFFKRLGV